NLRSSWMMDLRSLVRRLPLRVIIPRSRSQPGRTASRRRASLSPVDATTIAGRGSHPLGASRLPTTDVSERAPRILDNGVLTPGHVRPSSTSDPAGTAARGRPARTAPGSGPRRGAKGESIEFGVAPEMIEVRLFGDERAEFGIQFQRRGERVQ